MTYRSSFTSLAFATLTAVTFASFFTACGDDDAADPDADIVDAGPDAPPPDASASCLEATQHSDFGWIQANVFAKSCFFATSCHTAAGNAPAGLSLTPELAYAELVDQPSTQVAAKMRIAPGVCADSYLYDKITNSAAIQTGKKPMPPTFNSQGQFVPLCQEKIDAICRWIEAGALND